MTRKKGKRAEAEEQEREHRRLNALALCLGYNELAKLSKSLGEKVYYRLARDRASDRFVELGGNADLFARPQPILEIPSGRPWVKFSEDDIEAMRTCVAEYDERAAPHVCPVCHAVGEERCAPGCIDAEIERAREDADDDEQPTDEDE